VIHLVHGPAIFADTNAHGLGEQPQVVYNVRFDGPELWGDSTKPGTTVSIDLWDSYLEPAPR
jgi:nitrile hydratase